MVKIGNLSHYYQKGKEVWATSGQGYLFSQFFKPITTARRQATMKGVACTVERIERWVSINIVDRAGVRLIKTIESWKGGGGCWDLRFGIVTLIGRGVAQIRG